MSETVVELRDVFCVHSTDQGDAAALQGTSLKLERGEVLCVLGPSGAGKSTLLRVIAGIQEPSAGIVSVLGVNIRRLRARARARLRHQEIGLLSQSAETALPPDLPAGKAVALPLVLRGMPPQPRRARVDALLDAAALRDRADALPAELSGGERQRFALCAALAHRPALLLADEPTGELDDTSAEQVLGLIATLAQRSGASVVLVSHDAGTADVADRTIRIRDGRVAEERRHGDHALVIGRGGLLQLPSHLLSGAGIEDRAHARLVPGGLILSPDPGDVPARGPRSGAGVDPARADPARSAAPAHPDRPAAWSPARVELRDATRVYGQGRTERRVIVGLTHAFAPGRMTVVTGRSGTGKTTLLRILSALDPPDWGELLIDERRLTGFDREQLGALRRARIGYMPQEPSPVGFLGGEENVVLALRVRGWSPDAAAERAHATLTLTGLADLTGQRISRLSAGETQRVALARALASARGLLIVDEPTSRLDAANAAVIASLLADAAAQDGQTVICSTHDPVLIARADERLALS